MRVTKFLMVTLGLICSVALCAQDYKVGYIAEKFSEIHTWVLTGADKQFVKKNMEDKGCLLLEEIQNLSGVVLLSYVSHSDVVSIEYNLCVGADNRLSSVTIAVSGVYHTVSSRDIEDALTMNRFHKSEQSYGVMLSKNRYSKTKAVISKARNEGYHVNFTGDEGFQYITMEDYEKRVTDESLQQKIRKIKVEGVEMTDSLKYFFSEQIALRILQKLMSNTNARVVIEGDIVVLTNGVVKHKVNVIDNDSKISDEDLESSISSFKMEPIMSCVEDTTFVVKCYGTVSASCDWQRKVSIICKNGELQHGGKNQDFYDRYSAFIKEYLNGKNGKLVLNIGVININGTPTYFIEEYGAKNAVAHNVIDSLITSKTSCVKEIKEPKFLGGNLQSFSRWVNSRLIYPEIAKENGIQGNAQVIFTIDKNGNVCDVYVKNEIDKSLEAEAIRVVSSSPKWEPGYIDGKREPMSYTMPIVFCLR